VTTRREVHAIKNAWYDHWERMRDMEHHREFHRLETDYPVVYFVQLQNEPDSPIKIGTTTRNGLGGRLNNLQCGCPYKLKLLATLRGGVRTEQRLHRTFAADRVHGEWFNPSLALRALIDGCRRSGNFREDLADIMLDKEPESDLGVG
jgi:hypothetical protein